MKIITEFDRVTEMAKTVKRVMVSMFGRNAHLTTVTGEGNEISVDDGRRVLHCMHPTGGMEIMTLDRIRRAAESTHNSTGDGTSTTAILCSEFLIDGSKQDRLAYAKVLEQKKAMVIRELRNLAFKDITSELLRRVVSISMHGHEWSRAIADMVFSIGKNGSVSVEHTTGVFSAEKISGFQWGGGVEPARFNRPMSLELGECLVVISMDEIGDVKKDLEKVFANYVSLEGGKQEWRPLIVVSPSVTGAALATLNNPDFNGRRLPMYVVKPPANGIADAISDLASITGARLFSKVLGADLGTYFSGPNDFGVVSKVVVNASRGLFVPTAGNAGVASAIANDLREAGADSNSERISNLEGSVGIIKIPGQSDTVFQNLRELVDDGYRSGLAAMRHGVLPGAGRALRHLSDMHACKEFSDPLNIIHELISNDDYLDDDVWLVLDQSTGKVGNALENGVLDNAGSIIAAVENAIDEAVLLLKTENFIVYE